MERFYIVAGICYRVTGPDEIMYQDDGVLSQYRVACSPQWDHWLDYAAVETLTHPEGDPVFSNSTIKVWTVGDTQWRLDASAEICIARCGTRSQIQAKRQTFQKTVSPRIVLNSMEAEHQILGKGGFLLHAAYIRHGDGAILFTAPSGTGKSTQADLWCRTRGAELINGDRAAVCCRENGVWAMGVPFSGSSGVSKNVSLPLKAIVYLSQAPHTSIARLSGFPAFRRLWEGCSINVWNSDDVNTCTQNVMDAIGAVPIFYLACTPDESAVTALENALTQEEK